MSRPNVGKSFVVSTDDLKTGGLDTAAVQALIDKAVANLATKTEVTNATKDLATKTELAAKANAADVYTKAEADGKFQLKA